MSEESKPIYLVGKRDEKGTFWCWGEYNNENKAKASYELTCIDYPDQHIELIKEVKVHETLQTHLPL
jgi:hypothetical protein